MDPLEGQRTFPRGAYPLDEVVASVGRMDPASDEYRVPENIFGGETLCLFHNNGPEPLLGAYYRDNLAKALSEYKGEVAEIPLRDGEALVDASFALFFPNDVVGLVRTSSKAPSFARVGRWLTCIGGYACGLIALPDMNTLEQLDREAGRMTGFRLRARRDRLPLIREYNSRVGSVLRAAADVNTRSDEIGAEWRSTRLEDRSIWGRLMRQEIEELLSVIPEFEEAKVRVAGRQQEIDLKRSYVQHTIKIPLIGTNRVGPAEAAEAILEAYEQEQSAIRTALVFSGGADHDRGTDPTG